MSSDLPTRRALLHRLSFLGGGVVLLHGCKKETPPAQPRRTGGRKPSFPTLAPGRKSFTTEEYATLTAAVDRVLPRDEDPGALDADVPVYIDRMLATDELRTLREEFVEGLRALERRSVAMFQSAFAQAAAAQQDELLTLFKDGSPDGAEAKFYELLLVLTLEGFLGDPSYGGNKERVGWALVGFGTSEPAPGYDGVKHLRQGHAHGEGADARSGQGHGHGHHSHEGHDGSAGTPRR